MNLADLIALLGDTEPLADGVLAHCPAHGDSQASLRVTVSDRGKVLVKCRAGCETKDVLKAVGLSLRDLATMKPGEVEFAPATSTDAPASVEDVARLAVSLDGWARELTNPFPDTAAADALKYARERFGIEYADAERLGLGVATDLPGGTRLVVPFRDKDGVARGYQARALAKDAAVRWLGPKSPEGASWAKVGFFEGSAGWDEVLVTEGPGDSLTGVAIGYDTTMIRGAGLVSNPAVVDAVAELIGDRLAVICGDGDAAGRTFSATLAQGLLMRGCRVKILPVPDDHDLTSWRESRPTSFAVDVVRAIAQTPEETDSDVVLRERDPERYPLTDLGNAHFAADFIRAQGSGVKFSPEAGFFLLKGGVWRADKLDRTRAYVQEAAERVAQIAKDLADNAPRSETGQLPKAVRDWLRWAAHSQSSRGIDAAMKELQALRGVAIDVNDFDTHDHLLAVSNGVVDLRTGELLPHDPALLMTRKVEIAYRPEARAPRWEQFLDEVFPAYPDMPAFIRRLVGYGVTGRTDEQAFAVLWGTGANGKSVFTDTLTEVFRELTVTTPFETFEERGSGGIPNDLAALKGARLVMAAEGEAGRPMAEAVLKRVTGRDLISARFMRKEFFEFRPTFLLMLATNSKPKFRGQDEGLWRRVKLIPWERYFAPHERDHQLGARLLDEREGILAWAVRGAIEWFANGLGDPVEVVDATKNYRSESDVLDGFIPGVFIKDASGRVDRKIVFDKFREYADEGNYVDLKRWSARALYSALDERGMTSRKTGGKWVIEGLRRARQTDLAHDPEEERAEAAPLAHSTPATTDTPTRGASLDDVL